MAERGQLRGFLVIYALAWAGCSIAYVPFLTILLPVRVTALAGQGPDISWMAYIAFAGAIAASIGHIAFGYLSDVSGNRRAWVATGLVLSCTLLLAVSEATSLTGLIVIVVIWQLALNMMLAPLAALAGDCVPDNQKGLLGGLMAFAPGLGALSGAVVTMPRLAGQDAQLGLVAGLVIACVLPALIVRLPQPVQPPGHRAPSASADHVRYLDVLRGMVARMWFARLAVQVAEAALFAYLLFWFRSIDQGMTGNATAQVFGSILIISAPLALIAGYWADRRDRPLLPLVVCTGLSACALTGMALASTLPAAIATYGVFGIASAIFLALHSSQTLRVLPRSDRRGRDLGLFNLTNTLPSLIMPWLALALVPRFGFSALFFLFAVLAVLAGAVLLVPARRI